MGEDNMQKGIKGGKGKDEDTKGHDFEEQKSGTAKGRIKTCPSPSAKWNIQEEFTNGKRG